MVVLVGKNHSSDYYRFFILNNGKLEQVPIYREKYQSTKEIYDNFITKFLLEKLLVSVKYNTFRLNKNSEEYLGLELQNSYEEKFSVYFTSKALKTFTEFEHFIDNRKKQDFYEYAAHPIEKNMVERFTFRPTIEERSSVLYILNNLRYDYFQIRKQLGYYYRKNKENIDESDLSIIYSIIRYFINCRIKSHPYYEYKKNVKTNLDDLFIRTDDKAYIEIMDQDLIKKIEKARIIDDLCLVMHGGIDRMPLQEESINEKEELKRKRVKYLKTNPFS